MHYLCQIKINLLLSGISIACVNWSLAHSNVFFFWQLAAYMFMYMWEAMITPKIISTHTPKIQSSFDRKKKENKNVNRNLQESFEGWQMQIPVITRPNPIGVCVYLRACFASISFIGAHSKTKIHECLYYRMNSKEWRKRWLWSESWKVF